MTTTIEQSIPYPGRRVVAGARTDADDFEPETVRAFEAELEIIASAERDAASDADLIHLG